MVYQILNPLRRYGVIKKTNQMNWCTKYRHRIQELRYSAVPEPNKTIYINPHEIKYAQNFTRVKGLGQIIGGDWDHRENMKSFDDLYRVRGIKQRFEKGYEWEETIYYDKIGPKFENPPRKYKSPSSGSVKEYYDRFKYIDRLYKDMDKHGYIQNHATEFSRGSFNQFEPLIAIDRSGKFIFNDGRHRITLAQILDLDEIPVNILVRHREWQNIRDHIYLSDTISNLDENQNILNHPDIKDII